MSVDHYLVRISPAMHRRLSIILEEEVARLDRRRHDPAYQDKRYLTNMIIHNMDNPQSASAPRHEPVALFPCGRVCSTPGVIAKIHPDYVHMAILRHHAGDWGDMSFEEGVENATALAEGGRIVSWHHDPNNDDEAFLIITSADRSVTTICLPSENQTTSLTSADVRAD